MSEEWVTVETFYSRAEAELAKGMLEANEIDARIRADDMGGIRPELSFARGVRIQVHPEDEATAKELLKTS